MKSQERACAKYFAKPSNDSDTHFSSVPTSQYVLKAKIKNMEIYAECRVERVQCQR